MQTTLSRKIIQNMVSGFGKLITSRTRLPVLEHVLFSIDHRDDQECVTVRATDLDNTLTCKLDQENGDAGSGPVGSFLFPFHELKRLRDAIGAGENAILRPIAENRIEVKTGVISRTVESLPVDEYPCGQTNVPLTACDGKALLEAMSRAAVTAAGKNDNRPHLTGVYADPDNNAFVGTDGKRLTLAVLSDFPLDMEATIPVDGPLKFMASQAVSEDSFTGLLVEGDQRWFELRTGPWSWNVRCLEGKFPNYRQVIPDTRSDWKAQCTLGEEAGGLTINAVKQFPAASLEAVNLAVSGRGVLIFCPDNGSFVGVTLPDCRVEADERTIISFNRHFLIDAVKQGFRTFRINDPLSPILFTRDSGDLHVLMPLKDDVTEEAEKYVDRMLGEPEPAGDVNSSESEPVEQQRETVTEVHSELENRGPEAVPESSPEPDNQEIERIHRPQPEPIENRNPIVMTKQKHPDNSREISSDHRTEDPIRELNRLITETQETVRIVNSNMREIRKQAMAAERYVKSEEKKIRSREQDMARNLKLIEKLQDSVAA